MVKDCLFPHFNWYLLRPGQIAIEELIKYVRFSMQNIKHWTHVMQMPLTLMSSLAMLYRNRVIAQVTCPQQMATELVQWPSMNYVDIVCAGALFAYIITLLRG